MGMRAELGIPSPATVLGDPPHIGQCGAKVFDRLARSPRYDDHLDTECLNPTEQRDRGRVEHGLIRSRREFDQCTVEINQQR